MNFFRFFSVKGRDKTYQQRIEALMLENIAACAAIQALNDELKEVRETANDAIQEIDDAWDASPYPGNRKHLHLPEQMAALCTELEALRDENARLRAQVANAELEGPKRTLEKANDAQAARAMSRQTKQHFQQYQEAVKVMLDQLDKLGRGNVVTKEDFRKLRDLRKTLGDAIGRSL